MYSQKNDLYRGIMKNVWKLHWYIYYLLWIVQAIRMALDTDVNTLFPNALFNNLNVRGRSLAFSASTTQTKRNNFTIREFIHSGNESFKSTSQLCELRSSKYHSRQTVRVTLSRFSDSLTNDDIVRSQYSLLPYPAVSANELHTEWNYYKFKQGSEPYNMFFPFTFESLNHYLYQGKNNFRWVFETSLRNPIQTYCRAELHICDHSIYFYFKLGVSCSNSRGWHRRWRFLPWRAAKK